MEATQGDRTVVRYLFKRALEVNPRSRFAYVSWGLFEKEEGNIENARALFRQGHALNQHDGAILQVSHNRPLTCSPNCRWELAGHALALQICRSIGHAKAFHRDPLPTAWLQHSTTSISRQQLHVWDGLCVILLVTCTSTMYELWCTSACPAVASSSLAECMLCVVYTSCLQ